VTSLKISAGRLYSCIGFTLSVQQEAIPSPGWFCSS
jgi:hypothetical protein